MMNCPLCGEELKEHVLESEKTDEGANIHLGLECAKCKTNIEIFLNLTSFGLGEKKP